MTSTNEIKKAENVAAVILKADKRGRVHIPKGRRDELLREYKRSGMRAAEFAKWCGVKYTTLCGWLQRARKEGKEDPEAGKVKWLEAVVGEGEAPVAGRWVRIHMGRMRVEVSDAKMAIEILKELGVKPC